MLGFVGLKVVQELTLCSLGGRLSGCSVQSAAAQWDDASRGFKSGPWRGSGFPKRSLLFKVEGPKERLRATVCCPDIEVSASSFIQQLP